MCLVYLSIGQPGWPLLVAANRDEFHARPAAAAGPWPGHPGLVAGRDLEAGGTWMGVTSDGRFALLTNYRDKTQKVPPGAPSRGVLVRDFLLSEDSARHYIYQVAARGQDWAGFNLVVGQSICDETQPSLWYFSNRDPGGQPRALPRGRYVLSNHLLDTPWPKVQRIRVALDAIPPESWATDPQRVFSLLHDTTPAEDRDLPDTGLNKDRERLLSSPFIISRDYGTRCSTILTCAHSGTARLSELSYDARGLPRERHDWPLSPQHAIK